MKDFWRGFEKRAEEIVTAPKPPVPAAPPAEFEQATAPTQVTGTN